MKIEQIRLLFDYHYWAMDHLIDHLLGLPSGSLVIKSPHFYHETAFKTVLHVLDVDWSWIQRCKGISGTQYLWEVEDLPDMSSLRMFLGNEKERITNYINSLDEADLVAEINRGDGKAGPERWQILVHIVNHGTEHRTEIGHFLTEQGSSPGELGFFYFLNSMRHP